MKKTILFITILVMALSCAKKEDPNLVSISTTIFPLYDFAKQIGKDKVSVRLIVPAGSDTHAFEPRPSDIMRLAKCKLFLFAGQETEPWAVTLIASVYNRKMTVIDISKIQEDGQHSHGSCSHSHHHEHKHPHDDEMSEEHKALHEKGQPHTHSHIWLDFNNNIKVVEEIARTLAKIDPPNAEFYLNNSKNYTEQLKKLDDDYKNVSKNFARKEIIYIGHSSFEAFVERYGLKFISPYKSYSSNVEPSAKAIAEMIDEIRKSEARIVFHEELINPRIAKTIAAETGVKLSILHAAHNITKKELKSNITFMEIMYQNLANLIEALND